MSLVRNVRVMVSITLELMLMVQESIFNVVVGYVGVEVGLRKVNVNMNGILLTRTLVVVLPFGNVKSVVRHDK